MNKARATLGMPIPFQKYVDYSVVVTDDSVPKREHFLDNKQVKRRKQTAEETHYSFVGDYFR